MRIEFDPTNRDEATAVRAVLDAMYGREDNKSELHEVWYAPEPDADATEPSEPSEVPDLDSTGTPWDERIHSNPPTQNKDGTWRAKRGVTADVVAAVRAELEQAAQDPEEEVKEILATEPPLAPEAPKAPTPPAPPSPTAAPSFLDVMKAITAAQKDGKIDTVKVKEMCAAVGAGDSTMGLNGPDNADKREAFMALLASEVVL